jgi:hypothetical protein
MSSYYLSQMPQGSRFSAFCVPLLLWAVTFSASLPAAASRPVSAAAAPDACKVQSSKPGSIQQAVDSGCTTVLLSSGKYRENLVIPKDRRVSIEATAANTSIDGGGAGTVVRVRFGAQLTLTGLTIQNGNAYSGGILNVGSLTLINSRILNNQSVQGGGIYNYYGTVTLTDSSIEGNTASYGGGGIFNEFGTVTLTNSVVSNNLAGSVGGGIFNNQGTVTSDFVSVTGNEAGFQGGGIFNSFGTLTLTDSLIEGNIAGDSAGGIFSYDFNSVTLIRTSVTGNSPS